MSRSEPTITNPSAHFFEWRNGKLSWYSKDEQKNIEVKLPFHFLPLDQLHTITGYSDLDQSGFWSNEVRSTRDDFTVRTKKGVKYVGAYKNEQGIPQLPTGGRYTKSVYIAYKEGGGWVIGNIKLSGAALTAWIELSSKNNVENGKVSLTGSTEGKKGATTYHIPTFEFSHSTAEEDEIAIALDKDLQHYLKEYLSAPKFDDNAEPVWPGDSFNTDEGKATPEQLADFEKRKAQKTQLKADDFPDDDVQSLYNSIAEGDDGFDEGFTDADIPPEFR
jgi:hypothetical protein